MVFEPLIDLPLAFWREIRLTFDSFDFSDFLGEEDSLIEELDEFHVDAVDIDSDIGKGSIRSLFIHVSILTSGM